MIYAILFIFILATLVVYAVKKEYLFSVSGEIRNILKGIEMLMVVHSVILTLLVLASVIFTTLGFFDIAAGYAGKVFFSIFFVGLWQLIYVLPMGFALMHRQEYAKAKGVMIGAGLTGALNLVLFVIMK